MSSRYKKKCAFTLIEIMVAVFIVGSALLGIALVFADGIASITEIRQITIATQALQEEMELIRDTDFDAVLALPAAFNTSGFIRLNNPTGTLVVDNPMGANEMRRVTVTVSWTSTRGRRLTRSLATLISRNGL